MDVDFLLQLLERGGLPIVIIVAAFWYINKKDNFQAQQIKQWADKDSEEDKRLLQVITDQNTINTKNTETYAQATNAHTQEIRNLDSTFKAFFECMKTAYKRK